MQFVFIGIQIHNVTHIDDWTDRYLTSWSFRYLAVFMVVLAIMVLLKYNVFVADWYLFIGELIAL